MICSACGTANRDGAAFCRHCGRLLLDACPRCGAAAGPGANFCDACGGPISPQAWTGAAMTGVATSPAPPPAHPPSEKALPEITPAPADHANLALERFIPRELLARLTATRGAAAERRVVTLLFCDIQGSTALAEQLDLEEWTEIVNGAFEQMVRPVYKYEGTVARLMGDGLLAFFGAPIAHEDDPRRAILSGLAIVDGIRSWRETVPAARQLDVRVGINTGLVVVGAIGSDLRLEYSAIGDAINLAARMEQTAAAGTVQIAEDTYRLVNGQFEVEPLGGIPIKGKSQPVIAYRVVRRASSATRRASATLRAALVNRRMEWEALERAFDALGAGRGGILFLTGEAGMGKTRLIDEAAERLLPMYPQGHLYDAAAVSYESSQPYGFITRLLREPLEIMIGDPPERLRERLAAAAPAGDSPILETLFGTASAGGHEIAGEGFAGQLDGALQRFWRERAAAGPLVLALDELQWLDATSAERLLSLFHLTESAPVLFLCALRRERRSPGWSLKESAGRELPHRLTEIALHPLNDSESRLMLDGLLASAGLSEPGAFPDALATLILEKAEGNPLFLEEVVRHLNERGDLVRPDGRLGDGVIAGGATLPDSLLALLTARIDLLDDATRRTLQAASVIGRHFSREPLAGLVDDLGTLDKHLIEMQRMELIREVSRQPEPVYAFNHSLTHEAVYNTILLKQRRAMHRRVAETIEARHSSHTDEVAAILAHHFLEGEAPDRALPYLMQAAAGALRLHAPAEAIAYYERALPIALQAGSDTGRLVEINNNHGRALELQSRFAEAKALYESFERLASERENRALELEAIIAQGKLYANVTPFYDEDRGQALMERAMALAEATGNRVAQVRILWNMLNLDRFGLNTIDRAIANGEKGLALARELELGEELTYLLNDLGDLYGSAGQFGKAGALLDEARDQWRKLGNEAMLADNLSSSAMWESIRGNIRGSKMFADEAHTISHRLGNIWGEAYSLSIQSHILGNLGEIGQAISGLMAGIGKARAAGFMGGQIIALSFLSRLCLEVGDIQAAVTHARDGLEIGRQHLPQFAGMCIGRLALALVEDGELEAAAEVLADPLATIEQQQVLVKFDITLARIEMAIALETPEGAVQMAEAYVGSLEQMETGHWLPYLRHSWARALCGAGRLDEAADRLAQAVGAARSIDLRLGLWHILATWAEVEEQRGNRDEAARLWAEAADEIDFQAGRTFPEELRQMFLSRPPVMAALAAAGR